MDKKQEIGSYTAKGGFKNESDVADKFNNYKNDNEAKKWLKLMGYNYLKIKSLKAFHIPIRISEKAAIDLGVTKKNIEVTATFKKADIQIRLDIVVGKIHHIENLSLKKSNKDAGFNQVDKRPVDKYMRFWQIPESICDTLKFFTGEYRPPKKIKTKDKRRMFFYEMDILKVNEVVEFFNDNKLLVFNDVLRGRGALSADWFLVTRVDNASKKVDWILKDINFTCNFFAKGSVEVTKRGSLKIGKMTMQRKGGTPDPNSLQFKINPLDLFEA